jgi:oligoendopeptidase F
MRKYIASDFKCTNWSSVANYLNELIDRPLASLVEFKQWLKDKSELEAVLEEDMAWRYIRMTIDTSNAETNEAYRFFVTEIQPKLAPYDDQLNKKMMAQSWIEELAIDPAYSIYFRSTKTALSLYRDENIALETELNTLSQEYGAITGQQMISYKGEDLTMPMAANYLKDPDENIRKEVYSLIVERRKEDRERLDELFSKLVHLRHQVAINAGCTDYRDYKFKALGRFDYTVKDCLNFHESIEKHVVPLVKKINQQQAHKLGKKQLKPWDLEVDPDGKPALKPFKDGSELLSGCIQIFNQLDPYFSKCLQTMSEGGFLDLDSKPGKSPGGYNYPLYESGIPFIFMNAAGAQRDLVTMVHEGGHAVHSFLSRDLELTAFKSLPSEVAELASMSMELISMGHWDVFYSNSDDLKRAKREQLESIIKVLPWIATIDAFQHWIYTHPNHTITERTAEWLALGKRFGTGMVDFKGYEEAQESAWHRQLHLFEVPFYYIEYGIAQLGAIGIWKNYAQNAKEAIEKYQSALKLGYSKSIPEIYQTAGLSFDFSEHTVQELANFLSEQLNEL